MIIKKAEFLKALVLGFLLLIYFSSYSQSYLQFQSSNGHMIAGTDALRAIQGWPNIYKLDYATVLKSKEYHSYLNHPLSGISLTYIDHDHQATGKSLSISGFLQPSIINSGRHDISGRVSVGLSYVQNPFDEIDNPLQRAIGSNLNFFAEGQLIYTYDLSSRLGLNLTSGIIHISNAARMLPNSGFNILSYGLGVRYKLFDESRDPLPSFNNKHLEYDLGGFSHFAYIRGGLKSIRNLDYQVFPALGLNYTLAYRYHALGSFSGGLDVDYNEGFIQERKANNEAIDHYIPFESWRWAIAAGHELHMNRLSLITQYGFYLKRPHPTHRHTYQRYGLKYHLTDRIVIAATLRAHAGRADYMEWTIGRKLN